MMNNIEYFRPNKCFRGKKYLMNTPVQQHLTNNPAIKIAVDKTNKDLNRATSLGGLLGESNFKNSEDYNYNDDIPQPCELGVGNQHNSIPVFINQMKTNADGFEYYFNYLLNTPVGNCFVKESLVKCKNGQPKKYMVDNKTRGGITFGTLGVLGGMPKDLKKFWEDDEVLCSKEPKCDWEEYHGKAGISFDELTNKVKGKLKEGINKGVSMATFYVPPKKKKLNFINLSVSLILIILILLLLRLYK